MTGQTAPHLWVDASAGIAGDMLLAALLDIGASADAVRAAVSAVLPDQVGLLISDVRRGGLRALRVDVTSRVEEHPHRSWAHIRALLESAALPERVRRDAIAVFALLAGAEARVHGTTTDEVAFHEVGSWDSIADIVGVCAALADLDIGRITASPVALGSGRIATAHGELPVPPPAVLELARGWSVLAGGDGELATPTGMALIRALAQECGPLPPLRLTSVGIGGGSREVAGRPNVVRAVLGLPVEHPAPTGMYLIETNVDDMDPRVWPTVLADLLEAGAADAWLVPIVMKKGRPAHTLCALAHEADRVAVRDLVFSLTSTIGVRETQVARTALDRGWQVVAVHGGRVRIKVALAGGRIVHATPEFEDAAALARSREAPVRQVLEEAVAAAEAAGLRPGKAWDQAGAAI